MPERSYSSVAIIGEISGRVSLLVLLAALSACSGVTPEDQSQIVWNPGRYSFDDVVAYSPSAMQTERKLVSGEVVIGPNGPISMESTDGPCGPPEPRFVQQDEVRDALSFLCGDAHYTFLRRRIDVEVNMTMDVYDTTREDDCSFEVVNNRMVCKRSGVADTRLVSRTVRISNVRRDRN